MAKGSPDLAVIYGDAPQPMVAALLDRLGVQADLPPGGTVGIKPNLILPRPSESGATTDPRVVEGLLIWLRARGVEDLVIMESSWVGARTQEAFEVCGYRALAERHGVELVDLKRDATRTLQVDGEQVEVCRRPLEVDYLIDVPVLKAHCQTRMTCALKNLKGCIPDREKRRFHAAGLHRPIALLASALPVDLVVVDALVGDLTFEEGGTPIHLDRLIAGRDPVLVDTYAADLLGLSSDQVEHIGLACRLGVGSADLARARVEALNQPARQLILPVEQAGPRRLLADRVVADGACSACLGPLVHALQRLQERDKLARLPGPLAIGQGFEGKQGAGVGIGGCTRGLERFCDGCPPSARQVLDFLLDWAAG